MQMRLRRPSLKVLGYIALGIILLYGLFVSIPWVLRVKVEHDRSQAFKKLNEQFPVTVNVHRKVIIEDPQVNAYLLHADSPFQASIGSVQGAFWDVFAWIATTISTTPVYQSLAAADGRFVTVSAGYRKEQVAAAFGSVLGWTAKQKQEFLTLPASATSSLPATLKDGIFSPGIYLVSSGTSPREARALTDQRFYEEVLSRYGAEVAAAVPLEQGLIIASLIQREAAGPSDMRIVSGIIWNRLFINMKLQIDATVQYAQANKVPGGAWWPAVRVAEIRIKSPYNTYVNAGLPPGPISNPSVAAVLAALNPVATDCIFYFHDRFGEIHCSKDYAGHVAMLKKHYGRGK